MSSKNLYRIDIKEQKSRQAAVQEVCLDHGEDLRHSPVPLYDPKYRTSYLIYIPQLHTLYCIIPKAGSSTWIQGRHNLIASQLCMICSSPFIRGPDNRYPTRKIFPNTSLAALAHRLKRPTACKIQIITQ